MFKIDECTFDTLPVHCSETEFFGICEQLAINRFKNDGQIAPFSMFWTHEAMFLATWDFANFEAKDKSMAFARFMCKKLGAIRYFFASEVWAKVLDKSDPNLAAKQTRISHSGVEMELDKTEQLIFVMEIKGQGSEFVQYDIVRSVVGPTLGDRMQTRDAESKRLMGMLDY